MIVLYGVGIAIITLGDVVAPLVVGRTHHELEASEGRAAELESELADVRAERDELASERDELASERDELESALEEAREAGAASDVVGEDLQSLLDSLRASKARFELYEDNGWEHRWRLRHRNGNIMADGGEGYASRTKAQNAVDRFKLNAPNADVEDAE